MEPVTVPELLQLLQRIVHARSFVAQACAEQTAEEILAHHCIGCGKMLSGRRGETLCPEPWLSAVVSDTSNPTI